MIPLVAYERELELVRARVLSVAEDEGLTYGVDFNVGTMIELPRACFIADRIAQHADFFSFGTNDLTQAGIGFSRDDIEGRIIPRYVEEKIVDGSPFATIDQAGRRRARAHRRAARPVVPSRPRARRLRRARRRSRLDPLLPRRGPRLRQLLAVPPADRARSRRPSGDRGRRARGVIAGARHRLEPEILEPFDLGRGGHLLGLADGYHAPPGVPTLCPPKVGEEFVA